MRELIGDRNLSVVYVNHPELLGFFRFSFTGDSGFLAVFSTTEPDGSRDTHVGRGPGHRRAASSSSARRSAAPTCRSSRQRPALDGRGVVGVALPATGGCSWPATRRTSCRPPAGFGGNTGVARRAQPRLEARRWCASGTAGAALLDTYDAERRPVCDLTVEQAYTRYVLRVDPSLSAGRPRRTRSTTRRSSSARSTGRPRCSGPDEDDGALLVDPRLPGGRPGTRAPHLPVELDGARLGARRPRRRVRAARRTGRAAVVRRRGRGAEASACR